MKIILEILNYLRPLIMNKTRSVSECNIIKFDTNHEVNGNLTSITNHLQILFDIKRIYYLYDIPGGMSRGGACT